MNFKNIGSYIIAFVCACALSLSVATPQVAQAATSDEIKAQMSEVQARLGELYTEAELTSYELQSTTAALEQTNARIGEIEQQIPQTEADLDRSKRVLASIVSGDYKAGGTMNLLAVVLGAVDFDDFVSRITYANRISVYQEQVVNEVKTLDASLKTQRAELENQRVAQVQLVEESKMRNDAVEAAVGSLTNYLDQLSDEMKAQLKIEEEAAAKAAQEAAQKQAEAAAARAEQERQQQSSSAASPQENSSSGGADEQNISDESSSSSSSSASAASATSTESAQTPAAPSTPAATPAQPATSQPTPTPTPAPAPAVSHDEEEEDELPSQTTTTPSNTSSNSSSSSSSSGSSGSGYHTATSSAAAMVARAYTAIGSGYRWSGYVWSGSPYGSAFTCSGLVDFALGRASNSSWPESLYAEVGSDMVYRTSQLAYGDLVFYTYGGRSPGHVGIYVGDGMIIDSIPNGGVAVRSVNYMNFIGGGPIV